MNLIKMNNSHLRAQMVRINQIGGPKNGRKLWIFFQNQWNMWKIVPLRNLGIIQNCSVGVFFDAVFGNGRFYS